MSRLVLDTNSLVQCISKRSQYHDLWLSFLDGRNELCVTTEILDEYAEILERVASPKFSELALDVITNNPYTVFVHPFYRFSVIVADPDDDKFVDCAFKTNARYIVTQDHHYDVLKQTTFPHIDVVGIDEFIKVLRG